MNRHRRNFLSAAAALLAGCAASPGTTVGIEASGASPLPWRREGHMTVDMHSHAGRVIAARPGARERPFVPVAEPMREGGMNVICLAIVTDTYVTRVTPDRRIEAWRSPDAGELYALGMLEFKRARALVDAQGLNVILDAQALRKAATTGPSVIIASEGADFLEGRIERVDEAFNDHQLRHLQLTHYRTNELGDIQTATPEHGGLTDFGVDVVRRCNHLGIVVDVAHGTYALVKRAAATSTTPLVLSHTSLSGHPGIRSRLISADHARVVAETGGVVGVWPPVSIFHDMAAMVVGIRRLVDVIGVAHVGLGSDMLGLLAPAVFGTYRQLPDLARALMDSGFSADETSAILGDNYARVFSQSVR
jgi:membrane dipeptidase